MSCIQQIHSRVHRIPSDYMKMLSPRAVNARLFLVRNYIAHYQAQFSNENTLGRGQHVYTRCHQRRLFTVVTPPSLPSAILGNRRGWDCYPSPRAMFSPDIYNFQRGLILPGHVAMLIVRRRSRLNRAAAPRRAREYGIIDSGASVISYLPIWPVSRYTRFLFRERWYPQP